MKKGILSLMFVVALVFAIALIFFVTTIEAKCIGATQNFSCGDTITESCTLNSDLTSSGTCFTIDSDDIIVDCNGYSIKGYDTDKGFNVLAASNVTIKNCIITKFGIGIFLDDSSNNTLLNNTISSLSRSGIELTSSSYNNITNNLIFNASYPINFDVGNLHNTLDNNTIISSFQGITIKNSHNNIIKNNKVFLSSVYGIFLEDNSSNNILLTNVVNNNSRGLYMEPSTSGNNITLNAFCSNNDYDIYDENSNFGDENFCDKAYNWNDTGTSGCSYVCNPGCIGATQNFSCGDTINESCTLNSNLISSGTCFTIDSDDIVVDCNGYSIEGDGTDRGFDIFAASNVTIKNCKLRNFETAFYIDDSNYSAFDRNNLINNNYGFYLTGANYNNFTRNNINDTQSDAFYAENSINNRFSNNRVYNVTDGGVGIADGCNYNVIDRNNITLAPYCIYVGSGTLDGNNVTGNNLKDCDYGIYISDATNTYVYRNSVDNYTQYGIVADAANNNIFDSNEVFNGMSATIGIGPINGASENVFKNNKAHNNEVGFGAELAGANNNFINNIAENNNYGLNVYETDNCTFDSNQLIKNTNGINLLLSITSSCTGFPAACFSFNGNETGCRNHIGCIWNNLTRICFGTARQCFNFLDPLSCGRQTGCSWTITYHQSNRWNITNNIIRGDSSAGSGIYLAGGRLATENLLYNNSVSGYTTGLEINGSRLNNISMISFSGNTVDLSMYNSATDNIMENLTFGNTSVGFNYSGELNMTSANMLGTPPSKMTDINKFLKIENLSYPLEVNITFFYKDSDLAKIKDESSLGLYEYNGTWRKINANLNTAKNTISANLTNFSTFGIFGEEKPSGGGGGGGGGGYIPPVCGDGKCDSRRESYLNCPRDCPAPSEAPENVSQDLGNIADGKEFSGVIGEAFKFKVKAQEHIVQIGTVGNNSVTLFIWSSPVQVLLNVGEKKQIDLDRNNLAELEILLKKIENNKAFLFFKEIEEKTAPTPPSAPEQPPVKPKEKFPWLWVIIGAVVVIIIVALILWGTRDKKLKRMGYK